MEDKASFGSKDWKKETLLNIAENLKLSAERALERKEVDYPFMDSTAKGIVERFQRVLLQQNAECNKSCQKVVEKALKEQREELSKKKDGEWQQSS